MSEPHFLHGDPQLLMYARGLNPNEDEHETFIVIEPYTGTPLSGQKKIQLNLKLERQPVDFKYQRGIFSSFVVRERKNLFENYHTSTLT